MMSKLFKFIPKESLEDSPMLVVVTESMVQEDAKHLIGRELTESELRSFVDAIFEGDDIAWRNLELIKLTILCVAGLDEDKK